MRDALANIRLAFVQIKGRVRPAGRLTPVSSVRFAARSGRDPASDAVLGAAEPADGSVDDAAAADVTPSARSSAAWPAAGSVARRPSLRTTRHHGRSTSVPASSDPTARARPGNPASSATSP